MERKKTWTERVKEKLSNFSTATPDNGWEALEQKMRPYESPKLTIQQPKTEMQRKKSSM
jgi:hypothetical protein